MSQNPEVIKSTNQDNRKHTSVIYQETLVTTDVRPLRDEDGFIKLYQRKQ